MKKNAPTPAQLQACSQFGIQAPPTRSTCSSLLRWIANGGDREGPRRIAIIKDTQSRFLGKRITHVGSRRIGTVEYIWWRGLAQRAVLRSAGDHHFIHPLDAMVLWDDTGTRTALSVGSLALIE